MARSGKLTVLKVAAVARAKIPGYYSDGGGLFLQISRFGTASWVFRYRVAGRLRKWEWDRSTRSSWQMPRAGAQGTGTAAGRLSIRSRFARLGFRAARCGETYPSRTARNATSPLISRLGATASMRRGARPRDLRPSGTRRSGRARSRCRARVEGNRADLDGKAGNCERVRGRIESIIDCNGARLSPRRESRAVARSPRKPAAGARQGAARRAPCGAALFRDRCLHG